MARILLIGDERGIDILSMMYTLSDLLFRFELRRNVFYSVVLMCPWAFWRAKRIGQAVVGVNEQAGKLRLKRVTFFIICAEWRRVTLISEG